MEPYKNRMLTPFFALFLFLISLSAKSAAVDSDFFNEWQDPEGNIRAAYQSALPVFESLSEKRKKQIAQKTRRDLMGEHSMFPIPRLLTVEEADLIKSGITQRATALRMFLEDHYSGKKRYLSEHLIPKEVIDRIRSRNHEAGFDGLVNPEAIAFRYGPDIVRDESGTWRVLEDNVGNIGGFGKLNYGRATFFKRAKEYRGKIAPIDNPSEFYDRLAEEYLARANPPGSLAIAFREAWFWDEDLNSRTTRKELEKRGIRFVSEISPSRFETNDEGVWLVTPSLTGGEKRERVGYLVVDDDGWDWPVGLKSIDEYEAFSKYKKRTWGNHFLHDNDLKYLEEVLGRGDSRRVGLTIPGAAQIRQRANLLAWKLAGLKPSAGNWKDPRVHYRFHRQRSQTKERIAKALLAEGRRRLALEKEYRAERDSGVKPIDFSPESVATRFKRWDQLTGLSTSEKDGMKMLQAVLDGTLPTSFNGGFQTVGDKEFYFYVEDLIRFYLKETPILRNVETHQLTPENADNFLNQPENWVFKKGNSSQGRGVYVGKFASQEELEEAREAIHKAPEKYMAQRYTAMSRMGDSLMDIRGIAQVFPDQVLVSDTSWGRTNEAKSAAGRINVSLGGAGVATMTVDSQSCRRELDLIRNAH